jgi:alpha-L-rhamnosidase
VNTFSHTSEWIASGVEMPNAPLFRRDFVIDGAVDSALLHICGLGYYEAWINGRRVGDHLLDPAQTDYDKRVFYVSHDVTGMVRDGENAVGVILGNGWYNQARVWGDDGLSYGRPRLRCELHVRFVDGGRHPVGSDEHWTCDAGPVTDNNIYAGESYDARLEQPGWSTPGFDASEWDPVVIAPPPGGRLERQNIPPIRAVETLRPVAVDENSPGCWVVDMGQNFAGWARIRLKAPRGTEIRMRFAETLGPDGGIDTASTGEFATGVEQVDRYTCGGEGIETWEPRFTYHGFRYVEVTGWPGELTAGEITGVVVHTDLSQAGGFWCSDERLNRLHRMALWTHRSNIHGIPEDCPARERCGWLGDANMVAEYSMWNFEGKAFWEKYLDDIETTRARNGGLPCNIAPGKRTCGTARPDWAAAYIMLPYYLYVHYGDAGIMEKHWDGMYMLIEHFGDCANGWILEGGFGDWYDPGGDSCCTHTSPILTTTVWFCACASVMASTARCLGRNGNAERYESWVPRIRGAFIERFYDGEAGSFGSQTADAMALYFDLAPEGEEKRVLQSLVKDIGERDVHLNTGIMGVRFLFEVLTRHGEGELALALMHKDTYPSFGHLIQRNATTLWECWGEETHDVTNGPRSLNHPMMGGFDNWFYNTLAGIRPDPEYPGFERFFLEPHPIPGLDLLHVCHESVRGRIVSEWETDDEGFEWNVVVPQGSRAAAILPCSQRVCRLGPGEHRLVESFEGE